VQFAYTGWATVEILPESNPTPDDEFFLKFRHHNSFEAQAWKRAGRSSDIPVCTMSCGYSSGWCEESFGMALTTVEIECEAMGAEHCTFIMAPPGKIIDYLQSDDASKQQEEFDIPVFFEKKYTEDRLRASLEQKDNLLHEVHHRVKNNLQVISSLMNLQMNAIRDESLKSEFHSSMMRINTMARIHEMIYSDKTVASIPVEHYFRHLFLSLVQGYTANSASVQVEIELEVEEGFLEPDQAIPLGLILNEIAEYAFGNSSDKGGVFLLKLTEKDDVYHLLLEDQRKKVNAPDPANNLGFSLVPVLCEQLEATLETECSARGWSWRIAFKKTPDKKSRTAE
jgi:two-component sensor histidine kinase